MGLGLYVTTVFLVFGFSASNASPPNCSELIPEIRAMQKAQEEVKKSLVNNHEVFATTLEEYSDQVSGVSVRGARNPLDVAKNIRSSAKLFRSRGLQSQALANKLDKASEELLGKVAICLSMKR